MITDLKEIEDSVLNLNKKDKARLADKLLQSIHGKIDPEIEQQPASGTKITKTERRFLVSRFPYGIIYSVEEDRITLFTVMNLRRKPQGPAKVLLKIAEKRPKAILESLK